MPVFLSQDEMEKYYQGFGNSTVWPVFHYFPQYARYEKEEWETYRAVNQRFADAVLALIQGVFSFVP